MYAKKKKTTTEDKAVKKKVTKPKKAVVTKSILDEEEEPSGMDIAELAKKLSPKEATAEEKVNKHKLPGKHKLKYDSIFKGKKTEAEDETLGSLHHIDGFDIDPFSVSHSQKLDQAEYDRLKLLKEIVYKIIIEKTEINIKNNRRKPGRLDFNRYFEIIVSNMDMRDYSHAEIFLELSWYFSENIFSMFKLLDPKWGAVIVRELTQKYNIKKIDGIDFV
jgi:hypothetical protein